MKIIPAIHSSFPRIGENPDEQKLRRAYAGLEEGKVSKAEFTAIENDLISEVIAIQEKSGLGIITDGLIRWYDPVSQMARNFDGFEINGLLRFFDTNFYYRQPIYHGRLSARFALLESDIIYTAENTSMPIKANLLGPVSLAGMSLDKSGGTIEDLALGIADGIGKKLGILEAAGAQYIQIEEPWLARHPEYWELFKTAFPKVISGRKNAKIILAFYFADINSIYNRLTDIDVDMLGIDFTYSPGLMDKMIADKFYRPLALGMLDARNTKLEKASDIAGQIAPLLKNIKGNECHVMTSCGLEYLPRGYAIKKLELTAQVAKIING
jgi:5-methyltetrahydropteroyltriglutamate--homocysteine methyltransferase